MIGKPEVIQVGPISNDKSAFRKWSPRLASTIEDYGPLGNDEIKDHNRNIIFRHAGWDARFHQALHKPIQLQF